MIRYLRSVVLTVFALSLLTIPGPMTGVAQDATPASECIATTPEENEALAARYWSEVWTAGGEAAVAELLAADEVHHWGIAGDTTDLAAYTERLLLFLTAFPDIRFTIDLTVAEGDLVTTLWTATGTHASEWQGIAPTDREVTWQGINIFRIECGLIAESWGEADHLGLRQQLGATDAPMLPATPSDQAETAASAPAATPCPDDTSEANVAVAQRWTEDVLTGKDLDVLDEILDPAAVHHGATFPDARGPDAVKHALGGLVAAFPDMALTVDATVADGETVAVRWSGTGTQDGPFLGIEPTGKPTTFSGINTYRLSCGRIVESWSEMDSLNLLQQIGE